MKKSLLNYCFGLLLVLFSLNSFAQPFLEGQHYKKLAKPQPTRTGDNIEVLEFFWYGCPHCAELEPYMQMWKTSRKPANVTVVLVPTIFRSSWEIHAQAFYAAELMGVLDQVHPAIFKAIHQDNKMLNTAAQIAAVVATVGVDSDKFVETMGSFTVDSKVRLAKQLIRDYLIQGVPAVAVNGKYLTDGPMAGSYVNLLAIVEQLIAQETANTNNATE